MKNQKYNMELVFECMHHVHVNHEQTVNLIKNNQTEA